jgi:hypothetical protein
VTHQTSWLESTGESVCNGYISECSSVALLPCISRGHHVEQPAILSVHKHQHWVTLLLSEKRSVTFPSPEGMHKALLSHVRGIGCAQ